MIAKCAAIALLLATTPANAVSMSRDIYPLQQETQDLRRELEQLRGDVRALKERAVKITLDCTFKCKFLEPKEFDSLEACRASIPPGYSTTQTCVSFMGRSDGVSED